MKQRLAIINLALPVACLMGLAFAPLQDFEPPEYVGFALILFTLGRAFLLLQQQTIFTVIPMVFLALPQELSLGFDIRAPYAVEMFLLYLMWVNLQWGQRPWFGWLHMINWVLLALWVGLAKSIWEIPPHWWHPPITYLAPACALMPLALAYWWGRPGRWASYWPLLTIAAFAYQIAPESYLRLWMSLAALFSLTIDSYILAFVDELTGIPGRRALMFKLKTMGSRYGLVMVDVDHFKQFNDKHGHQVGDDVLKTVAAIISKTQGAWAYRYGGEEFTLVFNKSDADAIAPFVESTRKRIEEYPLHPKRYQGTKKNRGKTTKRRPLRITASFGLAMHKSGEEPDHVIERADRALYSAKANGRNQLVISRT